MTNIALLSFGPIYSHNLIEQLLKLIDKYTVHRVVYTFIGALQQNALILAKTCFGDMNMIFYFINSFYNTSHDNACINLDILSLEFFILVNDRTVRNLI